MKKLILIACALFAGLTMSAQKVDLRYNLQTGREYVNTGSTKMTMKQVVMGMTVSVDMFENVEISYTVKSFKDGVFEMEACYNRIEMEVQSAYVNMKMDSSDASADEPMTQGLRAMTGKPFIVRMTTKGKVTGVEGLDQMIEGVVADLQISDAEKTQIEGQLESSYGEESLIKTFEQSMAVYPPNAVAKGDKWTHESSMSNNGIYLNVVTEYEYAGLQGGSWIIKGKSKMDTPKDAKMYDQGMEMDIAMEGSVDLEIKMDPATGWIVSSTTSGDVVGVVSAEAPMQGRVDIDMTMSMSSSVSGSRK